jgi:hypothetical protein
MAIYGYARVSTRDQTLASQEAQLRAAACTKIYAEKVSGVSWKIMVTALGGTGTRARRSMYLPPTRLSKLGCS